MSHDVPDLVTPGLDRLNSLPPAVEALHLPSFTIPMLVLPNQGKVPVLSHSLVDFSSQINIHTGSGCWLASAVQGSSPTYLLS